MNILSSLTLPVRSAAPTDAWTPMHVRSATFLFFLLVFSARLSLAYAYGFDSPYSDQWGEVWSWLRPVHDHLIPWGALFAPHNEHRIALQRLVALALFILNDRQWDNLTAVAFNNIVVAALASLVFRKTIGHWAQGGWLISGLLAAVCCSPCGFENSLIGFQLSFYLLIALAVWGIWACVSHELTFGRVLLLALIGYASLFSMASGLFTPAAMALAVILRLGDLQVRKRNAVLLIVLLASAVLVGSQLLVSVPQSASLRAHDVADWLSAMRMVGSWPLPNSWFCFILFWLPTALAIADFVRTRQIGTASAAALCLALWSGAQTATIAFGRANDMLSVHSRYTDLLAVALFANAFFCLQLMNRERPSGRRRMAVAGASFWFTASILGLGLQSVYSIKALLDFATPRQTQTDNVRAYLLTGNPMPIDSALPWNLPLPDKRFLKLILDDPSVRDMMPPSIRPPLNIGAYSNGFVANGLPSTLRPQPNMTAYGTYDRRSHEANTAEIGTGPLHSRLSYLTFMTAGSFDGDDGGEMLLAVSGAGESAVVQPSTQSQDRWTQALVRLPAPDFSLHAKDASRERWFAFTAPVEVSALSVWVRRLLSCAPALLGMSLCASLFWVLWWMMERTAASRTGRADGSYLHDDEAAPKRH